jgi:hypothetical protein
MDPLRGLVEIIRLRQTFRQQGAEASNTLFLGLTLFLDMTFLQQ